MNTEAPFSLRRIGGARHSGLAWLAVVGYAGVGRAGLSTQGPNTVRSWATTPTL